MNGTIPIQDTQSIALKANYFQFYNESDGKFCWLTYLGPTKVLVNTSNNCFTPYTHRIAQINPRWNRTKSRCLFTTKIFIYIVLDLISNVSTFCPEYVFALPDIVRLSFTKLGKNTLITTQIDDQENEVLLDQKIKQQLKIPSNFNYGLNHSRTLNVFGKVIDKVLVATSNTVSLLPAFPLFGGIFGSLFEPFFSTLKIIGLAITIIVCLAILLIILPILSMVCTILVTLFNKVVNFSSTLGFLLDWIL